MARRRISSLHYILAALLLAGGVYLSRMNFGSGDPKNTAADSTVTSTSSGSDGTVDVTVAGIDGIFFSNAYANDPSLGRNDTGNIDRRLADIIRSARKTIDCALFELECERIADALIEAHRNGVRVRIVAESDYADNPDLKRTIDADIPVVLDERAGLMHNKFVIIDSTLVWTGSFNTTDNCAFRNNNNAILIRSPELAENYGVEFEEMFDRSEFGPRSTPNTPHSLVKLQDVDIYSYFSPEDDVRSKVLRFLKGAKSTIHFMAFSMTDDAIGDLLIERKRMGVDVEGVLESRGSGALHSELKRLVGAGIPVLSDGNKYALHHKVILIDGLWTILGSYNFTESAATANDENLLIIKSREVTREFEKEYQRVRKMALEPT